MNNMTNWYDTVFQDFGKSIKIDDFSANENGVAGLEFENGERLIFEGSENKIRISVFNRISEFSLLGTLESILSYCHHESPLYFPIRTSILGENMLASSISLHREQATLNHIEIAISQLRDAFHVSSQQ